MAQLFNYRLSTWPLKKARREQTAVVFWQFDRFVRRQRTIAAESNEDFRAGPSWWLRFLEQKAWASWHRWLSANTFLRTLKKNCPTSETSQKRKWPSIVLAHRMPLIWTRSLTFNLFTRTMNKEDESSVTVKTTLPVVASGVCQVSRNHHTTRSGFFKI